MTKTGTGSHRYRLRNEAIWKVLSVAACCVLEATVAFGQGNWTQQFPNQGILAPSGRSAHAMVYDAARNEVLLFGGIVSTFGAVRDTWAWDGFNWIQKSPPNSPSSRFGHAMAYDAARQVVVLFGGLSTSGAILGETWVWNGTNWTQMFPATSPPPRDMAAMTYDPVRNETVLFGGRGLFGDMLDDTWVWDGANWTQKAPAMHPAGRIKHAMTFDASHGEVLLFGGRLLPFPSDFGDTWVWDGANWTQRFPASSPPPLSGHALDYSDGRARVILFGGFDNDGFTRNDTWSWNGDEWARLISATSPPARTDLAMAYDRTHREMVLFGGITYLQGSFTVTLDDTWVFEDRVPQTRDDCKASGWVHLSRPDGTAFKNQGACVSYVSTGK
jgi:hypothetical protein